ACNTTTHLCSTACSAQQPCNGGCCNGVSCQPGTADIACGPSMGACVNCLNDAKGHRCIATSLQCGCASAADCPVGMACDVTTAICTTTCNANQPCAGGCCGSNNLCFVGSDNNHCGSVAGACVDCSQQNAGKLCLAAGVCGCAQASDCPKGLACNLATNKC